MICTLAVMCVVCMRVRVLMCVRMGVWQVLKTSERMRELGFHSIRMIEVRQRPFDGRYSGLHSTSPPSLPSCPQHAKPLCSPVDAYSFCHSNPPTDDKYTPINDGI